MLKFVAAAAMTMALASPALADTYTKASFSGGVYGGNANVQSPFTSILTQGQSLSGTFVFDNDLVPASGTGYVNVATSSFPDMINSSDLFSWKLGSGPTLTAANEDAGAPLSIQYNDGHFNGFAAFLDFTYQGTNYQADIQGGTFQIYQLVDGNPDYSKTYVSGYVNIGDSAVTNKMAYVPVVSPVGGVPEPASWAMLILGFGMTGLGLRYRRKNSKISFA